MVTVLLRSSCFLIAALAIIGCMSVSYAEDLSPPDFTKFWQKDWPARFTVLPPLRLSEISSPVATDGKVTFAVKFLTDSKTGLLKDFTDVPTNLPSLLALDLATILEANILTTGSKTNFPITILSVTPNHITTGVTNYVVTGQYDPRISEQPAASYTLRVGTKLIDASRNFAQANALWSSNSIAALLVIEDASSQDLASFWATEQQLAQGGFKPSWVASLVAGEIRGEVTNAVDAPDSILKTLPAPIKSTYGDYYTPYLSIDGNGNSEGGVQDKNVLNFLNGLVTSDNYHSLTNNLQSKDANTQAKAESTRRQLFWALASIFHQNLVIAERSSKDLTAKQSINDSTDDGSVSRALTFPSADQILGFTNFVDKIEQLPYKEVEMNLGQGIAHHFIVVSVKFQNTTTNDLLLYGDAINYDCKAKQYSWNSPKAFKYLLEHVADESFTIIQTNSTNSNLQWTTRHGSAPLGNIYENDGALSFRPIPLTFLTSGFDIRQFYTTKAWIFRAFDTTANIASGVIPFVNMANYANYAGIYSGLAVPSVKKLFGDMTDIQRQIFLQESMPQYLELKVGQSVSKLVYLPRFGSEKIAENRVVFISELGNEQNFHILAAMIKNIQTSPPAKP